MYLKVITVIPRHLNSAALAKVDHDHRKKQLISHHCPSTGSVSQSQRFEIVRGTDKGTVWIEREQTGVGAAEGTPSAKLVIVTSRIHLCNVFCPTSCVWYHASLSNPVIPQAVSPWRQRCLLRLSHNFIPRYCCNGEQMCLAESRGGERFLKFHFIEAGKILSRQEKRSLLDGTALVRVWKLFSFSG